MSENISVVALPAITIDIDALLQDFSTYVDAKPRTVSAYLGAVRSFWKFLRETGNALAGREAVMAWREYLRQAHKPATIQLYLTAIKRFLAWASSNGHVAPQDAEGARGVKSPKTGKDFRKDCLSAAQARKLLESIDRSSLAGKRDYAMLSLMLTCGLRDIEVARATVGDLEMVAGQAALAVFGKGRDEADARVKLAPAVEKAIHEYLDLRGELDDAAPLFASASNRNAGGAAMTTRSISRIVKDHLKGIGLDSDRLTAHSLRHTAATLNLLNGGSLEETQALLRHASVTTTMKYAHHIDWSRRQAESRIAAAIF